MARQPQQRPQEPRPQAPRPQARSKPQRVNPPGAERTADRPADHEGSAGADPSGRGGTRSRSSRGSAGYGGQPGMGGYEQGFQRGPASTEAVVARAPGTQARPKHTGTGTSKGKGEGKAPDGLDAVTSSTESGDGSQVASGRLVKDPGSIRRAKP